MFSRSVRRFFSCIFLVASAPRCLALSQQRHFQESFEAATCVVTCRHASQYCLIFLGMMTTPPLGSQEHGTRLRRVKSKNTKPELVARRLLHVLGYRFRINTRNLPGCPDIVFSSRHKVIFVHGCFWHQHRGCKYAQRPKSRLDYWAPKFLRNRIRDNRVL